MTIDEPNVLEVNNLQTVFHTPEGMVRAVDGISLGIPRSRTLGVLGESGCGKSVTALSILRLIPDPPGEIRGGEIVFENQDLLTLPMAGMRGIRGDRISMIFQEPMTSLNPVFTIGEQIAETVVAHRRMSRAEAMNLAVESLEQVGIPSPGKRATEYPHQLSGGMRQRAMIAMAMVCRPNLLIADEPTTALDVTIQAQILDLMLDLQEEMGMAIMMITHDLGVIAEVSDQVVVMYAGQVVEYAPSDRIFTHPRHPYSIGLMNSIPMLGSRGSDAGRELKEIPGVVPNLIRPPDGCLFAPRCNRAEARCKRGRPPLLRLDEDRGVRCRLMESEARRALPSADPAPGRQIDPASDGF